MYTTGDAIAGMALSCLCHHPSHCSAGATQAVTDAHSALGPAWVPDGFEQAQEADQANDKAELDSAALRNPLPVSLNVHAQDTAKAQSVADLSATEADLGAHTHVLASSQGLELPAAHSRDADMMEANSYGTGTPPELGLGLTQNVMADASPSTAPASLQASPRKRPIFSRVDSTQAQPLQQLEAQPLKAIGQSIADESVAISPRQKGFKSLFRCAQTNCYMSRGSMVNDLGLCSDDMRLQA